MQEISSIDSEITSILSELNSRESITVPMGIWNETNVSPLVYHIVLYKNLGKEYIGWEPETLRKYMSSENISELTWNKIFACKALHDSDLFWEEFDTFQNYCVVFNNDIPDFSIHEDIFPSEILNCIHQVSNFIKSDSFGDEIDGYVAALCNESGFISLPMDLSQFQGKLNSLYPESAKIASDIETNYELYKNTDISEDDKDAIKIGIAKRHALVLYLKENVEKLRDDLKRLG